MWDVSEDDAFAGDRLLFVGDSELDGTSLALLDQCGSCVGCFFFLTKMTVRGSELPEDRCFGPSHW